MRKSTSKIVSLMIAASMMFTTVIANTSFVSAATEFPVVVTTANVPIPLDTPIDANTDVEINVNFSLTAMGGSGALFNFQAGTAEGKTTDSELAVRASSTAVGIGRSAIVSTETLPLKYEPETNELKIKYERATGLATLTVNGESITATVESAKEQAIVAVKVQQKGGRTTTINSISVVSGSTTEPGDNNTTGPAVETSTEEPTETSTEAPTETSTEAPTETSTEDKTPDLGTYDPSSNKPQGYVTVGDKQGVVEVKTGEEIQVDFKLSGNTGFTNYGVLIDFNPEFLEYVSTVKAKGDFDSNDNLIYPGYVYHIGGLAVTKPQIDDAAKRTPNSTEYGFEDTKADGNTTQAKLGRFKIAEAFASNNLASNDGTLVSIKFKVIGIDGTGWARMMTGHDTKGFSNVHINNGTNLDTVLTGTKFVIASETPTEDTTSNVTTEATTSNVTTETTTETTTVDEDITETTTRKTSGGGGGGSSSSNASKGNSSSSSSGSITAQPSKPSNNNNNASSNNNTTAPKATVSTVGDFVTESGVKINPPALKNTSGDVVAGSSLNNSSLVTTNTFSDIATRTWAQTAINKLSSLGVVNGVKEGSFAPDSTSKRGDFMVMLTKVLGLNGTAQSSFSDVPSNKYYANAVNLAKDLGLANGVGDNQFNPESAITRQDMMVLSAKALEVVGYDINSADLSVLDGYADANNIASYAKPYVAFLISAGIVNGTSDSTVSPVENMTRAQMAVLISNIYDLVTDAVVASQEETKTEEVEATEEVVDADETEATEEISETEESNVDTTSEEKAEETTAE